MMPRLMLVLFLCTFIRLAYGEQLATPERQARLLGQVLRVVDRVDQRPFVALIQAAYSDQYWYTGIEVAKEEQVSSIEVTKAHRSLVEWRSTLQGRLRAAYGADPTAMTKVQAELGRIGNYAYYDIPAIYGISLFSELMYWKSDYGYSHGINPDEHPQTGDRAASNAQNLHNRLIEDAKCLGYNARHLSKLIHWYQAHAASGAPQSQIDAFDTSLVELENYVYDSGSGCSMNEQPPKCETIVAGSREYWREAALSMASGVYDALDYRNTSARFDALHAPTILLLVNARRFLGLALQTESACATS